MTAQLAKQTTTQQLEIPMYYGTTALALINIRRLRRIEPEVGQQSLIEYGDTMFPRLRAFLMCGTHGCSLDTRRYF